MLRGWSCQWGFCRFRRAHTFATSEHFPKICRHENWKGLRYRTDWYWSFTVWLGSFILQVYFKSIPRLWVVPQALITSAMLPGDAWDCWTINPTCTEVPHYILPELECEWRTDNVALNSNSHTIISSHQTHSTKHRRAVTPACFFLFPVTFGYSQFSSWFDVIRCAIRVFVS
jgi:hypothetical protein